MSANIVVTGANRGIGLAFVNHYIARGDAVYGVCRHSSEELSNSGATVIEGVDVATADGALHLKDRLTGVKVDVLINNAGILRDESLGDINYETVLEQFSVNAVGPLRVTEALLDNLSTGAKIGLVTSRMGSITDNTSGGRYGYRMSKAALNIAGKSLAGDLKSRGISVAILHPGYVQTRMVGYGGDISADVAAQRLIARLDDLNLDNTGTFWHSNGEVLPW